MENCHSSQSSETAKLRRILSQPVRQMACRMWQPDADTDVCSITNCEMTFTSGWSGSRRHHCRQCGRVVCNACSRREKFLLPPLGEKGQGKKMRVCDACMRGSETFVFCNPEFVSAAAAARRHPAFPDLVQLERSAAVACSESQVSESGPGTMFKSAMTQLLEAGDKHTQASSYDDRLIHDRLNLPSSTLSTAETPDKSTREQMRKEAMPINNPCKAPPANDGGLENCEFYKGLKTYEPAALEALLADRKRDEDKTVADPQTK